MKYIVYKHTCTTTQKSYIGITFRNIEKRSGYNGSQYKKIHQPKFYNAIKKYGWDNFTHEVIEENISTLEEANEREKYWISYYDSYNNGYNSTLGGEGNPGHLVSEKAREKMRNSHIGIKMKQHTEEWKRERSIQMTGKNNPMFGKIPWNKGRKATEEEKIKNSISHKGLPSPRKNVKLSKETKEKISLNLKGRIPWNKGKILTEEQKKNYIIEKRCKKVVQLDKENNFLEIFMSVEQAAKKVNGDPNNIRKVCKKRKNCKSAYGFKWKYLKDEEE